MEYSSSFFTYEFEKHLFDYYKNNHQDIKDPKFLEDLITWADNGYNRKETSFWHDYFVSENISVVPEFDEDAPVTDIEQTKLPKETLKLFKRISKLEKKTPEPQDKNRFTSFKALCEKYESSLRFYLGDQYPLFMSLLERLPLYPYQISWAKKGMRTFQAISHQDQIKGILAYTTILNFTEVDIIQLLRQELPEDHLYPKFATSYSSKRPFSYHLAYLIDSENQEVIDTIDEIITSENANSILTHEIILGVLCSKNQHLNDLLLKLLLAAQRQEGLRQAILEQVDMGRIENITPYLKLIKEENLTRFAAVKRAASVWTGLFDDENVDRITGKEIDYLLEGFTNTERLEAMLSSTDNLQLLIGLSVLGNYNLKLAIKQAKHLLETGEKHTRFAAAHFIKEFSNITSLEANEIILRNKDNLGITAILIHSLISNTYNLRNILSTPFDRNCPIPKKDFPSGVNRSTNDEKHTLVPLKYFGSIETGKLVFEYIKSILDASNENTIVVENVPFKGMDHSVERGKFAEVAICYALLIYSLDESIGKELLDQALQYIPRVDSWSRDDYFYICHYPIRTPLVRESLLEGVKDRVESVKAVALFLLRFGDIELTLDDLKELSEYYRYKSSVLRTGLTNLILEQPDDYLLPIIEKLLSDGKQDVRLGGLDILLALRAKPKKHPLYKKALPYLDQIKKSSAKEKVLIAQCRTKLSAADMPGFGLYDPDIPLTPIPLPERYDLPSYADIDLNEYNRLFDALKAIVIENADRELDEHYGETITLGTMRYGIINFKDRPSYTDDEEGFEAWQRKPILERVYYPELWQPFIEKEFKDARYLELFFAVFNRLATKRGTNDDDFVDLDLVDDEESNENNDEKLFDTVRFETKLMGFDTSKVSQLKSRDEPYDTQTGCVRGTLDSLVLTDPTDQRKTFVKRLFNLAIDLLENFDEEELYGYTLNWRDNLELHTVNEISNIVSMIIDQLGRAFVPEDTLFNNDDRKNIFIVLWNLYIKLSTLNINKDELENKIDCNITVGTLLFALDKEQSLITTNDFYQFIIEHDNRIPYFEALADHAGHSKLPEWRKKQHLSFYENKELAESLYQPYVNIILESELTRGDSPTKLSGLAPKIPEVVGTDVFARIITALGRDKFYRSSYYSSWWSSSTPSKKESLSALMRASKPAKDETDKDLAKAFENYKIDPKPSRLAEVALYAEKWQNILEKYSGIKGLVNGALFFRAHNSEVSEQYEAEIARLTPVPIDDLREGAFDVNWFNLIYDELGDENLDIIYDAAKYITDGISHTRARKFVDASLGRFDIDELEETIFDKRNKDLVLAYPLLPMPFDKKGKRKANFTKELVRRYTFLQKFLKSSKQFGAQRQASEAKVVQVALRNLATSAGYADVTRMSWQVETDLFKEMEHLFATHEIDGYQVTLAIDSIGRCDIEVKNNKGKTLKSIPSKIKKDEKVVEIIDAKNTATEQWRRSRTSLEIAMENEDTFTIEELRSISNHPILRPLLENLVVGIVDEGTDKDGYTIKGAGFFDPKTETLTGVTDTQLPKDAELLIAHPVHLHKLNVWSDWQKHLFDKKIKQPFKQIFRELYVPTEDELKAKDSRRYAGQQIQPKVAVGVLKKRLWVVDPNEGLQKIDYKRGIISTIYAEADWFSPSDIEPPAIEWVVFYDRKKGHNLELNEVSPVMFSETMRDVDLVVSVAHAGNVDPMASHSTIEMRRALVELSMPLFKMKNVTLTEKHAVIKGKRAEYTVHLGSGMVHQKGGAQIAVLAVQSQTRGRIFLPFVDDDPKTAEILSKILMFSEDNKIKDPTILNQISK